MNVNHAPDMTDDEVFKTSDAVMYSTQPFEEVSLVQLPREGIYIEIIGPKLKMLKSLGSSITKRWTEM